MKDKRVIAYWLLLGIFTLFLTVGFLESFSYFFLKIEEKRGKGGPGTNLWTTQTQEKTGCQYSDTLFPHPYLSFVHHGNSPCGIPDINNVGLYWEDYPSEKRTDRFTILLTGGSVASQLTGENGTNFLEKYLNEHYEAPNHLHFLVLNGADGGWKQPQQSILYMLYVEAVDGVISLDGFNEHYYIGSPFRFEYPASNFHLTNPLVNSRFSLVILGWAFGQVKMSVMSSKLLSHSFFLNLALWRLDLWLRNTIGQDLAKRKTTVESIFRLPSNWSTEKRKAWALDQYRKYIRVMHLMAQKFQEREAHFIQPAPALDKQLTPDEQRVVGDLGYANDYAEMNRSLLGLNAEGIPVYSLVPMLKNLKDTMYGDQIHFLNNQGRSLGYELMAEKVASYIARPWGLVCKPHAKCSTGTP